jgi:hypothetical protein
VTEVVRSDWAMYCRRRDTARLPRQPVFGDYGVTHPDAFVIPPYIQELRATLRYTTERTWLILRHETCFSIRCSACHSTAGWRAG